MYREKDENYSIIKAIPGTLRAYDEVNEIDTTKPTLIALGGNMTDNPQLALGMSRIAKSLLGLNLSDEISNFARDGNINTYSINYGVGDSEDYLSSTYLSSEEIYDLTTKIFYHQIFKTDNELFTSDEIKNNFSKIHFFTHCYGGYVLKKVVESLCELCTIVGLNYLQIKECLSAITAINYAPLEIPELITNINIISLSDDITDNKKYAELCPYPITIQTEENNLNILSKKIVSNEKERGYINDHNIKNLYRTNKWKSGFYDTSEGTFSDFIYPGGNAECISEIVAHIMGEQLSISLRNNNEEKLTTKQMADLAQNIIKYYSEEQLSK